MSDTNINKSTQCAVTKCKKEGAEFIKLNKKFIAEKDSKKRDKLYLKQLESKEMKNMNNCYAKKCPDHIRNVIQSHKTMATSTCDTEKKDKIWRNKMCKFASDVQKILNKKKITGADQTAITLKLNKLILN